MFETRFVFGARNTALAAVAVAGGLALAASACSSEATPSIPTFDAGDNLGSFMGTQFTEHEVKKCSGQSYLLTDGHIRTVPDASIAGENEVEAYENNRGNVLLSSPDRVSFPNDYGASNNWYIFNLPNGQEVFVNQNALVSDKFECSVSASPSTPLGTVSFKS